MTKSYFQRTRGRASAHFAATHGANSTAPHTDPGDSVDLSNPMTAAREWLSAHGIPHALMNSYQIKIEPNISYYPHKGTFLVDGAAQAIRRVGLDALGDLLREHGFTL